jgi:hypothetical protein
MIEKQAGSADRHRLRPYQCRCRTDVQYSRDFNEGAGAPFFSMHSKTVFRKSSDRLTRYGNKPD